MLAGQDGIAAGFNFFDLGDVRGGHTECRITSSSGTTCTLAVDVVPAWHQWIGVHLRGRQVERRQRHDQDAETARARRSHSQWTCGGLNSSDDGYRAPLAVTLTVTDSTGATVTVSSGSGSQPPLFLRLFKC